MNLNLGAGTNWKKEGWLNVDKIEGSDAVLDFESSEWPFEQESADLIFCSHVLEHLTDKAFRRLLKNAYRTLKVGGAMRVIVPDFGLAMRQYAAKKVEWFSNQDVTREISLQGNSMPRRFLCFAIRYKLGDYVGGPQVSNAEIEDAFKRGPDEFLKWAKRLIPKGARTDHCNAFWQERLNNELISAGFTPFTGDVHAIKQFAEKEFWNRPKISLIVDSLK